MNKNTIWPVQDERGVVHADSKHRLRFRVWFRRVVASTVLSVNCVQVERILILTEVYFVSI